MSEKPELKHAGADWREIYHALETAIKVRHYSSKTLKAYRNWTRQFQNFTKSKDQRMISVDDVKAFLSFLAVRREISASSQNQAFNALLFLFRHVLGKDFGKVEGVVRAKRKPYIPVVLSREEIDRIIGFLQYPYDLIARLLYGCGLRLSDLRFTPTGGEGAPCSTNLSGSVLLEITIEIFMDTKSIKVEGFF